MLNEEGPESLFQFPPTRSEPHSPPIGPPRPPPKRISGTYLRTVLDRPRAETYSANVEQNRVLRKSLDHSHYPNGDPHWRPSHLYPNHSVELNENPWYPQQLSPHAESPGPPLPQKVTARVEPTASIKREVFYIFVDFDL